MAMSPEEKTKANKMRSIKAALKNLEKSTKKEGIAYVLGEKEYTKIEAISTGSIMFDLALGVGGIPKGRIIELYGGESSGKSLISTRIMSECQKNGGIACLIDAEHAFDPMFAKKLGLDIDELIVSQPDHLQDAAMVIETMIDAGVDVIVLDSVAALTPKEEFEEDGVDKQTIGLVARYLSRLFRKITPKLSKNNCTLIAINQTRTNIGVMYGDPTTTPGGRLIA